MNRVELIGRLTKSVEAKTSGSGMAVARFSIAISRGKDKDGNDRGADFPSIVCFGKTAENCEKYLGKGSQISVEGHLQTGSYKKEDGSTVYTTDVIADRIQFLSKAGDKEEEATPAKEPEAPSDFELLDENEPF